MTLKGKISNAVILTISVIVILLLIVGTVGRLWNAAHGIAPELKPVQQEEKR